MNRSGEQPTSGKEEAGLASRVPPTAQYSCNWCGEAFSKQMGWKYHVDNNSCSKAPSCKWCRQVFSSIDAERYHAQSNACGKAPFCGWCKKIFISHQEAGAHIENNVCGKIPQEMESEFEVAVNDKMTKQSSVTSLIEDSGLSSKHKVVMSNVSPAPRIPSQHKLLMPNVSASPWIPSQHNLSMPSVSNYRDSKSSRVPSQNISVPQVATPSHTDFDAGPDADADAGIDADAGPDADADAGAVEANVDDDICMKCGSGADEDKLLLCDGCDNGCHLFCLDQPLLEAPKEDWFCKVCDSVACSKCNLSRETNNHIRCHICKLPYHMDCVKVAADQRANCWYCPKCNIFCKYCNKWFKSADGLKYHLKNNVCKSNGNPAENRMERAERLQRIGRVESAPRILMTEQDTNEQNGARPFDAHGFSMSNDTNKNTELDRRQLDITTNEHCDMEPQSPNDPAIDDVVNTYNQVKKPTCNQCGVDVDSHILQVCDGCSKGYHLHCAEPPLTKRTEDDWYCKTCNAAPCVACASNHSSSGNPVRCYLCRLPFHLECITATMAEYSKTWSCGKCKTLVCKHCKKSFKSSDGLKYHMEKNVCRVLITKEIVATCSTCLKPFTTQSGYAYHIQNVCTPSRKKPSSGKKKSSITSYDTAGVDGKRRRVPTDRLGARVSDDEESVNSNASSSNIEMVSKKHRIRKMDDDDEDGVSDGSVEVEMSRGTRKRESRGSNKVDINARNWESVYNGAKTKWNLHNIDANNRDQNVCLSAAIQANLRQRVSGVQVCSLKEWLCPIYIDTKVVDDILASFTCSMEVRDKHGPDVNLSPLSSYNRNQSDIVTPPKANIDAVISVTPTVSTSLEGDNPYYCKVCDMTFMGPAALISHEKSKVHNQLKTGSISLDYGTIKGSSKKQRMDNVHLSTDFVVNTCIPITSVAVCPNISDDVVYGAVGGSHFYVDNVSRMIRIDEEYVLGKSYYAPNLLQIWEIGKVDCKLLYFIGLRDSGPIWQCKWLSLEKVPDKLIGILSVICGNGTCIVLMVPKIDTTSAGNDLVIDGSLLVLWKICLDSVTLTASSWDSVKISETESTLEIMCGSLSGIIYHWDLGAIGLGVDSSHCLVNSCTNHFQNVRTNSAYPVDSAISAISICPIDRALFLVASYNGTVSVWNKRQKHKPSFSKNYLSSIGWINDAKWDPHGIGVYLSGSDTSSILFQRFVPDISSTAEELIFHESYYACGNSIHACAYEDHTVLLSVATDGTVRFCFPSVSSLLSQNSSKLFASGQLFHIRGCEYKDTSAAAMSGANSDSVRSRISCEYYSKCYDGNSRIKDVIAKKHGFTSVDMILCQQTPLCVYGSKSGLLRIHTFEQSICQTIFGDALKTNN